MKKSVKFLTVSEIFGVKEKPLAPPSGQTGTGNGGTNRILVEGSALRSTILESMASLG